MKFKFILLASVLFIACGEDSSGISANNETAAYNYTNCIQTVFDYEKSQITMYDADFAGLLIDSAYVDKGNENTRGNRIYTWKGYYKNGVIDSVYEGDYRDGEWEYRGTKNKANYNIKHEGNIWTISASANDAVNPTIIYFDGDSLATTSTDEGNTDTIIYVLKNDTLYRADQNQIIVMDEHDSNICYEKENRDGKWYTWHRFNSGVKDDMVILTKTYIDYEDGLDHKAMTYFMYWRNGK